MSLPIVSPLCAMSHPEECHVSESSYSPNNVQFSPFLCPTVWDPHHQLRAQRTTATPRHHSSPEEPRSMQGQLINCGPSFPVGVLKLHTTDNFVETNSTNIFPRRYRPLKSTSQTVPAVWGEVLRLVCFVRPTCFHWQLALKSQGPEKHGVQYSLATFSWERMLEPHKEMLVSGEGVTLRVTHEWWGGGNFAALLRLRLKCLHLQWKILTQTNLWISEFVLEVNESVIRSNSFSKLAHIDADLWNMTVHQVPV